MEPLNDTTSVFEGPEIDWQGRLQLLVLQPTPFCNLDCEYCYLANRSDTSRMAMSTLDTVFAKVARDGWAGPRLSVVWHAGEPLVVGTDWYEEAFAVVAQRMGGVQLRHHFQTNAVLLNEKWCELIARHDVKIGVSLDGPAFLHDRKRKTRDGKGTHAKALRGVDRLQKAGIDFHAICVLTRESLAYPDEIFDFFASLGATHVGFNIEEVEADNARSSLMSERTSVEQEFRAFFRRILERQKAATTLVRIREIEKVISALQSPSFGEAQENAQNAPGRILNVGWDGTFTTWSPELLGCMHPRRGSLSLGQTSTGLEPSRTRLQLFQQEIDAGVAECRRTCKYFSFCLGGAPANKLGEHGRFDVTETMFCRLTEKAVVDVVLESLDADLPNH